MSDNQADIDRQKAKLLDAIMAEVFFASNLYGDMRYYCGLREDMPIDGRLGAEDLATLLKLYPPKLRTYSPKP